MSLHLKRFAGAAVAALLASGAANAQQAGAPGAPPAQGAPSKVDAVPVQAEWNKICEEDPQSKKQTCLTTRDFGVQADQPMFAVAVYDQKGAPEPNLVRLLMPLGTPLRAGFRLVVDKNPAESGSFEVCFPGGCFADAKIKAPFVDSMKKGERLFIIVKQPSGAETTIAIPLAGFGKSWDGPPVDRKVLEEQQKKLQEQLEKKAEEQRGSTSAPTTPAPAPKK